MTPERRVKAKLKRFFDWREVPYFAYWPVPSGYGKQMVDCLYFFDGRVWAFECKREGETKPTKRQAAIMRELRKAGVPTWIVTMENGELVWLEQKD